ncbi:hypothetical protein B7463_g3490, partial [Scytalidium lignicola]
MSEITRDVGIAGHCDESIPECTPCRKRGFPCSGYTPVLVWVTPNDKGYESGRRRALHSPLTWRGHKIYDSDTVDGLISQCNIFELHGRSHELLAGPFTVFASATSPTPSPQISLSNMDKIFEDLQDPPQAKDSAAFLFHHYLSYVARNMMPFEDPRNPWRSFYPFMARCGYLGGQKSLLYAILAQAAGNLAHLGWKVEYMSTLTIKYYALAIESMRKGLQEGQKDFSLIYNGKFKAWKLHFNGGWDFINSYLNQTPWHSSEAAWLTSQSLCLLKIRFDTMQQRAYKTADSKIPDFNLERSLISSVASRTDFGFTTGASSGLLNCIMEITRLASDCSQMSSEDHRGAINQLYQRVKECSHPQEYSDKHIVKLHHRIFQLGAIIYFHRAIFNSPPRTIVPYIDELLRKVKDYQQLGVGYVTLWPVFVAAVEVYKQEHKVLVREWLHECDKMGAASRKDIRELIEAVWERRASIYERVSVEEEQGEIVLDWREVMKERQLDILLV